MNRLGRRRDRRSATAFILLDRSRCEACWQCVDACPQEVLGKVDFLGHRHAKIRAAEDCKGCGRCVKACEAGALTRLERAEHSSHTVEGPAPPKTTATAQGRMAAPARR